MTAIDPIQAYKDFLLLKKQFAYPGNMYKRLQKKYRLASTQEVKDLIEKGKLALKIK